MSPRSWWTVAVAGLAAVLLSGCRPTTAERPGAVVTVVARAPRLDPDFAGAMVPRNIAPLSFVVREPAQGCYAELVIGGRTAVAASGLQATIVFPEKEWHQALASAPEGQTLALLVSARAEDGQWRRYAPVSLTVGPPIDRYLVYRQIGPVYSYWSDVRIQERDLQSFRERTVISGGQFGAGCVNCHTFYRNRTERMTLNVRGEAYGDHALLAIGNHVTKMAKPWGYNSWHPNGQFIAYSLNKVRQFFHDAGPEVRDVIDLDSDIVVYRVDTGTVMTAPALAEPDRLETYPYWSADGRYLYYCSAPIRWPQRKNIPRRDYKVRYDLRRIAFDAQTGQFGAAETVISAAQVGKSVLLPRPSPDGRWLLFCMCDYSCFPIYQPSSDLYLMDLRKGSYRRLEINSDRSESWHSWSSDSQWIAFSSKRRDGLFTRTYLAHVDDQGRVSKPLIVPRSDPVAYDTRMKTATVPELVTEPVRLGPQAIGAAVRGKRETTLKMPDISMTRKPSTPAPNEAWQQPQR